MRVIDFPHHPQNIHSHLMDFLCQHSQTVGARVLSILISRPGTLHDVLELSLKLIGGQLPTQSMLDLLYSAWGDVPLCDSQALREYRQRLSKLEQLKALRLASDPTADCSELDWETDFLRAEIRNSTKARGGIKNFRGEKKRAYNRLRLAIVRLLNRCDNPLLRAYIERNLRTGLGFVWMGGEQIANNHDFEKPIAA